MIRKAIHPLLSFSIAAVWSLALYAPDIALAQTVVVAGGGGGFEVLGPFFGAGGSGGYGAVNQGGDSVANTSSGGGGGGIVLETGGGSCLNSAGVNETAGQACTSLGTLTGLIVSAANGGSGTAAATADGGTGGDASITGLGGNRSWNNLTVAGGESGASSTIQDAARGGDAAFSNGGDDLTLSGTLTVQNGVGSGTARGGDGFFEMTGSGSLLTANTIAVSASARGETRFTTAGSVTAGQIGFATSGTTGCIPPGTRCARLSVSVNKLVAATGGTALTLTGTDAAEIVIPEIELPNGTTLTVTPDSATAMTSPGTLSVAGSATLATGALAFSPATINLDLTGLSNGSTALTYTGGGLAAGGITITNNPLSNDGESITLVSGGVSSYAGAASIPVAGGVLDIALAGGVLSGTFRAFAAGAVNVPATGPLALALMALILAGLGAAALRRSL